jgi:hypothetical protein
MKTRPLSLLRCFPVWLLALFHPDLAPGQTTTTNISPVLGFASLSLPAGYTLIADPLLATTNDLDSVLAGAPDGSFFYAFDNGDSQYVETAKAGGLWKPQDDLLNPGGGGLLYLPAATTLYFFGDIPQGDIFTQIPAGLSILSLPVPADISLTNGSINFPFEEGETIYRYDNNAGQFDVATFANGQFNPASAAFPGPDEAFFILRTTPAGWSFPFTVNARKPRHPGPVRPGTQRVDGPVQQGTLNFCNVAGPFDQPILGADGNPLDPAGTNYFLAELMAGSNPSDLAPVPGTTSQIINGRFFGGSVTVPAALATNGPVVAQVVAWDGMLAAGYGAALANPLAAAGQSAIFTNSLTVSDLPLPPATMTNFTSFVVSLASRRPGPLTISLIGTNILLQWPPATNVVLQETYNLYPPIWQVVANSLGAGSATNSIGTNTAFYRLMGQ